ncbi:MAG: hypothetical protein D4R93_00345 [Deltaproteobacteria bacterium]|nr:MAG: hypothetical protein D4R93_00345 [Deltaproteobacteria bacterium]
MLKNPLRRLLQRKNPTKLKLPLREQRQMLRSETERAEFTRADLGSVFFFSPGGEGKETRS